MADLLLELFSEEIPARMQVQASKDLERLVVGALSDRGLLFEAARPFAGPRRLTLAITGLPFKQPDVSEEKKGPRVGAPEKAIEGFLKSAGVTLDKCEKRSDAKGEFYVAVIARKGRETIDVLAEVLPEAIGKLPWPKSMRWGDGSFRWVRPLHSILATLDGEVIPFQIELSFPVGGGDGSRAPAIRSGNTTRGHRFLSKGELTVRRFEDYEKSLRDAHVILEGQERRETILHDARQKAFALSLELIEDEGLANEVMGLAEWPVVLIGQIDPDFMDVPPEILQTSMRTHQKYFALRDPARGKLANRFAVVANMVADDGGYEIVAGNERVLRARLSDAKFFWDHDRKVKLANRVDALKKIIFHAKLGTQYQRIARIEQLARQIATKVSAGQREVERAAQLCKADLTTDVVGEFPELQGVMGRYYALHDGEPQDVADAIRDHYRPLGPSDAVPTAPVSIAVALADKLDTLTSFFAIGEKPTGSGDPYALRRAALGIIRILSGSQIRLGIRAVFDLVIGRLLDQGCASHNPRDPDPKDITFNSADIDEGKKSGYWTDISLSSSFRNELFLSLIAFFADRLKVALREKGVRHDLIDAVFALGNEDDLVRLVRRVEALQSFLRTDDGANLLTGYRRAANILRIEEKKDKTEYRGIPSGLTQDDEIALQRALTHAKVEAAKALSAEDFEAAMKALASLRVPVDRFFDKVTVNTDDKGLRENRLKLLSQIVETAHQVADFSKIEG